MYVSTYIYMHTLLPVSAVAIFHGNMHWQPCSVLT